jgi:hypothetical protein
VTGLPDPLRSRAILIGVGDYRKLENLPAVHNNLVALGEVLRANRFWGLPSGNCVLVDGPETGAEMLDPVAEAADAATDTLLLYYAGHGLVDRRSELYLTLAGSDPQRMYTSVRYDDIRDILLDSRAARRLVILDCCYSGRALGQMSDPVSAVMEEASAEGTYILAATAENRTALAPPGWHFTAFTGELLDTIHKGIGACGPLLDLDSIYRHLRTGMREKGFPVPQKRDRNTAGLLTLVRNQAFTAPSSSGTGGARSTRDAVIEPAPLPEDLRIILESPRLAVRQAGVTELARLLDGASPVLALAARQALEKIANEDHPRVAELARRALDASPAVAAGRVRREGTTRAHPEEQPGHEAQEHTAQPAQKDRTAVPVRNDRAAGLAADAERIAQSITDEGDKAWTLAAVAEALAATDPDRAARLAADAERIAQSLTDEDDKALVLGEVAEAVAATDPDRAERIALYITDEAGKGWALAQVAEAVAATDPDRAERIALYITDEAGKAWVLAWVAEAVAATDPDRAERIAQSYTDYDKAWVLAQVAKALAATDPDRAARLAADAEGIAQSLTDEGNKAWALAQVAVILAATDPDRAERIAQSLTVEGDKGWVLAQVAVVFTATHPQRRDSFFQSLTTDEGNKARVLAQLAVILAAIDPERAERTASPSPSSSGK